MPFALLIVARDLHHIFAVRGDEIGVGVGQFLAHSLGVFDVHAEDDGFGKAVTAFEKLGNLLRHELATFFHDQMPVEVGAVIDAVFTSLPSLSLKSFGRTPAFSINVERDLDDFVGCEKAVINALLE